MAALLREIVRVDGTVVVVGSHGHRRAVEILIGGVTGELLHRAPCSVFVARPAGDPDVFPRSIVVGIDGSSAADDALAAGEQLARRLDVPLRVLTALRGKMSISSTSTCGRRWWRSSTPIRSRRSSLRLCLPTSLSSVVAGCMGLRRSAASPSGSPIRRSARCSSFARNVGERAILCRFARGGRVPADRRLGPL